MPIGYKHTIETIEKMRQAKLKNPVRYWLGKGRVKERPCETCGIIFFSPAYQDTRIYCSRQCAPPWNRGKKGSQVAWNKGLVDIYSEETKQKMGIKNKGRVMPIEVRLKIATALRKGNTLLFEAIRKCFKYKEWHKQILLRDNFTCILCQRRGGKLEVDHYPKMFNEIIKENQILNIEKALKCIILWETENGRTLCVDCHRKNRKRNK